MMYDEEVSYHAKDETCHFLQGASWTVTHQSYGGIANRHVADLIIKLSDMGILIVMEEILQFLPNSIGGRQDDDELHRLYQFAVLAMLVEIDATVFPLYIPWFNGTLIVKDTLLVKDAFDFLCLSHSFTKNDVRPTLLCDDDEGRHACSTNPFKVKTGEQTLATDEVPLLTETEGRVISPFDDTISLVDHIIHDELKTAGSKKKSKLAFVAGPPPVKRARTEDVSTSGAWPAIAGKSPAALQRLDLVSSVTPTSEHEYEDDYDHGNNVRTRPPSGRFTVLSSSSTDTDILASPQVVPSRIDVGSEDEVRDISAPKTEAEGIDNPTTCHNFLDYVTPPGYWAVLRNQSNIGFLKCFNINSAQHTSMAKLGKAENEAAEVVTLCQHVTELEMAAATRATEVVALNEQNGELSGKVSALESVHGKLDGKISELTADCNSLQGKVAGEMKMREEFKSVQDAAARCLDERVAKMNDRIADCAQSVECRTAMGKVISMAINKGIQEGLKASIKHGKEGRLLAQIEAYDPETEAMFVAAVFEFENVSFPLLDELEGLRDSPLTPIMPALTLKDDHGNVDTSPLSAERRGLCSPFNPLPSTSIGISNYQISTLASPHDVLFDIGVLDKPIDA
ncbi:hypothetical protein Tco_0868060 [Tanacetum coccineum]